MQQLLVALWCKLHNWTIHDVIDAFNQDFGEKDYSSEDQKSDVEPSPADNRMIDSPSVKEIETIKEDVKEVKF